MKDYLYYAKFGTIALGIFCLGLMLLALIQANIVVFIVLGALFILIAGARVGISLHEEDLKRELERQKGMEVAQRKLSESTGTFYFEEN